MSVTAVQCLRENEVVDENDALLEPVGVVLAGLSVDNDTSDRPE